MPLSTPSSSPLSPLVATPRLGGPAAIPARESLRLAYCTNVHPGEDVARVFQTLRSTSAKIASRFKGKVGVGAWFSSQAAEELLSGGRLDDLISLCQSSRLKLETLNGFPFGNFHQDVVKHEVYQPHWAQLERLDYTLALAKIASALCRPGDSFGISTLPLGWRGSRDSPSSLDLALCAFYLAQVAFHLWEEKQNRGVDLHLDLEPEPGCWLETSGDVILFFKESLLTHGVKNLTQTFGVKKSDAEDLLRAHLQICYDTCHAAVAFEEPRSVLQNYESVGLKIGKVQMSSAIIVADPHRKEVRSALRAFAQDRYLHQVIGRSETGRAVFFQDLPEALAAWDRGPTQGEFRVHCHVPIHLSEVKLGEALPLATTQAHLSELIQLHRLKPITPTWEVETYTWGVLPNSLQVRPPSSHHHAPNEQPSRLLQASTELVTPDPQEDLMEKLSLELNWALTQLEGRAS
jgi:hypothetical protein